MLTSVVNIRNAKCDIFIGRSKTEFHFGNPFSSKPSEIALFNVASRYEAIKCFYDWISGDPKYRDIEPERRQWVLDNLESLRGKSLGCFCMPAACHGSVFRHLLGEISYDEIFLSANPAKHKSQEVAPLAVQHSLF